MSNLIAVAYPDQHRAVEVLSILQGLQRDQKIDLEDAICVVRTPNGKVEYVQIPSRVGAKVAGGGAGGLLVGMLILTPVVGVAIGAGAGLMAARKSHRGAFEKDFINKVGANLQAGGSALVMLVRSVDRDAVLPAISSYGGTVIESSLAPETQARLQEVLSGGPSGTPLEARIDIPIGAIVYCSDGTGGKVARALVDPLTMQVANISVRAHESFGREFIVPTDLIEASTSTEVRLHLTRAELNEMPTYQYQSYGTGPRGDEAVIGDAMAYNAVGWNSSGMEWDLYRGYDTAMPGYMPPMETIDDGIPPGQFSLSQGDDVQATDGKVGRIDQLLVSKETGTITHIVMRDGHLWGKKAVPIPISKIEHMGEGIVYLRLSKQEVAELPEIPLGSWHG